MLGAHNIVGRLLGPVHIGRRLTIASVVVASLVGACVPLGLLQHPNVAFWLSQSAIVLLPIGIALRSLHRLSHQHEPHRSLAGTPSLLLSVVTLIAVTLPGFQLLTGLRESQIHRLGFPVGEITTELTTAYSLWLIGLVCCWVGDEASSYVPFRFRRRPSPTSSSQNASRATFVVLFALGLVGTSLAATADLQAAFSTRGATKGGGILVLLEYGLPLASSLALLWGHWGRWWPLFFSGVAIFRILSVTGTRTPLLLVGVTAALLVVRRVTARRPTVGHVLAAVVLTYVGTVLSIAVGAWRGAIINGLPATFIASVATAASNPLAVTAGGLDTLDGLILSAHVDGRIVGASPLDPLKGVINLVPYQLWPDKPEWLSATVTHFYLSFGGGAGIFLSGPGYLYIIAGTIGTGATFFGLGLGTAIALDRNNQRSMASVLLVYFLLRFAIGGDAFDILHVLGLGIAYFGALTVGGLWARRLPKTADGGLRLSTAGHKRFADPWRASI